MAGRCGVGNPSRRETVSRPERWIEGGKRTAGEIATMGANFPAAQMRAYPVSTIVNSLRHAMPEWVDRWVEDRAK